MSVSPELKPWLARIGYIVLGFGLHAVLGIDFSGSGTRSSTRRSTTRPANTNEELKLVLVVNDSLKMGKGKIGAQCAHAAVGIVEREKPRRPGIFKHWESTGQAKICLKSKDDVELRTLMATAMSAGVPAFIVQDAGRTQVAAGSRTVLAIGPAPKSELDKITGHLKLL